jgi:hypothetical protein
MLSSIDRWIPAGSSSRLSSLSPSSDSVTAGAGVSSCMLYRLADDDLKCRLSTGVGVISHSMGFVGWGRADPDRPFSVGNLIVSASVHGIGGHRPILSHHSPLLPCFPVVTWLLVCVIL